MGDNDVKRIEICFYKASNGNEPVLEWLRSLSKEDKKKIGEDLRTIEYGWPTDMPMRFIRSMKGYRGLWEFKTRVGKEGNEIRIFFTAAEGNLVLLHYFYKTSNKTPKKEIEVAVSRMKGKRDD